MIPIHLTIKGLYSYQSKQEIDFLRLTRASVFGIFGSVGSGKSTILEAITFALYGKTERLNLSGDNRNYNMMNLKSNDLLIQFQFKAGKSQDEYLVVVKGKRNSKRFDDVKSFERTAYIKKSGEFFPIEVAQMEAVLGLSYENFKRTIIIPQGKFQEFLQLGNADRTKMMKELFNLEKFELYYKVSGLEIANNEKLHILDGKLQAVAESNQELIPHYEELIKQNQEKANFLVQQISSQREKKQEQDALKTLTERLLVSKQKVEALEMQKQKYLDLEAEIKAFEYCFLEFKPLLDAAQEAKQNANKTHDEYQVITQLLKEIEQQVQSQKDLLAQIQPDYEKRDELIKQADELSKVESIVGWKKELATLEKRISDGNVALEKEEQTLKLIKEQIQQASQELLQLKKERLNVHELHDIKAWFIRNDTLIKEQKNIAAESQKVATAIEFIVQSINESLGAITSHRFILNQTDSVSNLIESEIEQRIRQGESLDSQIEHARVQLKLADFANHLEDGQACPVCGSTTHPQLFDAARSEEALKEWDLKREAIKNEIKTLQALAKTVSERMAILKTKQDYQLEILAKKEQLLNEAQQHEAIFSWDKNITQDWLTGAFEKQKQKEMQINQLEEFREKLQNQEALHQTNLDKYQKAIAEFQLRYHGLAGQIKTLASQLLLLDLSLWEQKTPEDVHQQKTQWNEKALQLETAFTKNKAQLEQLENKQIKASEKAKALYEVWQNYTNDWENKKQKLAFKMSQSEYKQIEQVTEVLSKKFAVNEVKQTLANYNDEVVKSQQQLADIKHELQNRTYDPVVHQQIFDDLQANELKLKEHERIVIENQKLLGDLKNQLAKKERWQKEKNELEERAENIKTLKQLFKGNGFVNYISTVHLQNLCQVANERFFKLTGQKLSLEITSDNNFQVRDFLNDGNVRHVKTLSGGQTFQAALSLALALADSVNKLGNSKENFFFLDEGFGNLDKESLQVVFETLKSLKNENRIVGVISHVEEIQHEIDTHIRIKNDEENGSFIVFN